MKLNSEDIFCKFMNIVFVAFIGLVVYGIFKIVYALPFMSFCIILALLIVTIFFIVKTEDEQ